MKLGSLKYSYTTEEGSIQLNADWRQLHTVVRKDILIDWQAQLEKLWKETTEEQIEQGKRLKK